MSSYQQGDAKIAIFETVPYFLPLQILISLISPHPTENGNKSLTTPPSHFQNILCALHLATCKNKTKCISCRKGKTMKTPSHHFFIAFTSILLGMIVKQ